MARKLTAVLEVDGGKGFELIEEGATRAVWKRAIELAKAGEKVRVEMSPFVKAAIEQTDPAEAVAEAGTEPVETEGDAPAEEKPKTRRSRAKATA